MPRPAPDLRLVAPSSAAWAAAWAAGAVTASAAAAESGVLALAALIAAAASGARPPGPARAVARTAAVALAVAAVAALGVALRARTVQTGPLADLARARAAVRVDLVVTSDPQWREPGAVPGSGHAALAARAELVTTGGRAWRVRVPIAVVGGSRRWIGLLPGQRVSAVGTVQSPARTLDAAALLVSRSPPVLVGPPPLLQRWAGRARAALVAACARLPADARALVPALVIGDTSAVPRDLDDAFTRSGLTHLMAVSGANLAIVSTAVLAALRACGAGRRACVVGASAAIAGFAVLARPQPSVLRAAGLALVGVLGLALGRPGQARAALAATVTLLLLADPGLARSWSFALSVAATAGLLAWSARWSRALGRWLPRPLAAALAVPAAAQVACAPLLAALSGQLSLVAVPANLLAAPGVAPATVLGVVATCGQLCWAPLGRSIATLAGVPAAGIAAIARAAAAAPLAVVGWPSGWWGATAVGVLLGVGAGLVVARTRVQRRRRALAPRSSARRQRGVPTTPGDSRGSADRDDVSGARAMLTDHGDPSELDRP